MGNDDDRPAWRANFTEVFTRAMEVRTPQEPPHPERLMGAAIWFAENGLPVFPLYPGTKIPYPKSNGVHGATTDVEQVIRWWSWRPDSNIGLATGHGIDVIDFDGPEGHQAWTDEHAEAFTWEQCGLYVLATVATPRTGGLHVYLDSTGQGNRAGLVDHIDFRGLGGYVVAPPSHTNAGRYVFLDRLDPAAVTR